MYCKEDMKNQRVPMIVAIHATDNMWDRDCFNTIVADKNSFKVYMGMFFDEFKKTIPFGCHIFDEVIYDRVD